MGGAQRPTLLCGLTDSHRLNLLDQLAYVLKTLVVSCDYSTFLLPRMKNYQYVPGRSFRLVLVDERSLSFDLFVYEYFAAASMIELKATSLIKR